MNVIQDMGQYNNYIDHDYSYYINCDSGTQNKSIVGQATLDECKSTCSSNINCSGGHWYKTWWNGRARNKCFYKINGKCRIMEYWRNDYNRGAPIAFVKNEEAILGCRYSDALTCSGNGTAQK